MSQARLYLSRRRKQIHAQESRRHHRIASNLSQRLRVMKELQGVRAQPLPLLRLRILLRLLRRPKHSPRHLKPRRLLSLPSQEATARTTTSRAPRQTLCSILRQYCSRSRSRNRIRRTPHHPRQYRRPDCDPPSLPRSNGFRLCLPAAPRTTAPAPVGSHPYGAAKSTPPRRRSRARTAAAPGPTPLPRRSRSSTLPFTTTIHAE